MNRTKLYYRIPERVRLGVGGIVLAVLFVTWPRLLVAWLRFWS